MVMKNILLLNRAVDAITQRFSIKAAAMTFIAKIGFQGKAEIFNEDQFKQSGLIPARGDKSVGNEPLTRLCM